MRLFRYAVALAFVMMASAAGAAFATDDPGTVKEEIAADKQAIKDQHGEIKQNAQEARAEERQLKGQIKEARQAGDKDTAKSLTQQLVDTHKENVAGRRQDVKELNDKRRELKEDRRAARRQLVTGGKK